MSRTNTPWILVWVCLGFLKHLGILIRKELSLLGNLYRFGEGREVPMFEIAAGAANDTSLQGTSYLNGRKRC